MTTGTILLIILNQNTRHWDTGPMLHLHVTAVFIGLFVTGPTWDMYQSYVFRFSDNRAHPCVLPTQRFRMRSAASSRTWARSTSPDLWTRSRFNDEAACRCLSATALNASPTSTPSKAASRVSISTTSSAFGVCSRDSSASSKSSSCESLPSSIIARSIIETAQIARFRLSK